MNNSYRLKLLIERLGSSTEIGKVGSLVINSNSDYAGHTFTVKLKGKEIAELRLSKIANEGWILIETINVESKYRNKGLYRYLLGISSRFMEDKINGYKGLYSDSIFNDIDRSEMANAFWKKMVKDGYAELVMYSDEETYNLSKENARKLLKLDSKIKAIS